MECEAVQCRSRTLVRHGGQELFFAYQSRWPQSGPADHERRLQLEHVRGKHRHGPELGCHGDGFVVEERGALRRNHEPALDGSCGRVREEFELAQLLDDGAGATAVSRVPDDGDGQARAV